jgi:hypothetical protein
VTYNLLTVGAVRPETMGVVLAGILGVPVGAVEVADPDGDPDLRNWDAPVSCDYRAVHGDIAWSLDIHVQGGVTARPPEPALAARFARAGATTVLFPAAEAPPSAYWAVTPEGLRTRARLELSDDEPPLYEVTAVEAPVRQLPRAVVTRFAEIVREQRPDTPVTEAFATAVEQEWDAVGDGTGGLVRSAQSHLIVWERLVRQLESAWAPSGWYPADLYRERLEARDGLAALGDRLPRRAAEPLARALEELDSRFTAATEDDPSGSVLRELTGASAAPPARWWWHRRPEPVPWGPETEARHPPS